MNWIDRGRRGLADALGRTGAGLAGTRGIVISSVLVVGDVIGRLLDARDVIDLPLPIDVILLSVGGLVGLNVIWRLRSDLAAARATIQVLQARLDEPEPDPFALKRKLLDLIDRGSQLHGSFSHAVPWDDVEMNRDLAAVDSWIDDVGVLIRLERPDVFLKYADARNGGLAGASPPRLVQVEGDPRWFDVAIDPTQRKRVSRMITFLRTTLETTQQP